MAFATGTSFTLTGVSGIFDGMTGTHTIDFFSNSFGGGFQVVGGPGVYSQQVYTGGENRPFVSAGDYFATDRATGENAGLIVFGSGTVADVPEPASWVLLITGFGMVGAGLRRRAKVNA